VVTEAAPAKRNTWALVVDRNFGPYFWGNIVSSLGVWGYNIAAVVVVFDLTRSALFVGLVSIVQFSVPTVMAPIGGALADRFDRRRILVLAQTLSGAAVAALAGAFAWAGPEGLPGVAPILTVSFVLGLGLSVTDPARHALVPALVPPRDISQAIALNTVTFNVGRAVGPAVAGLLLVSAGPGVVFGLTALTYAVFVAALLVINPRREDRAGTSQRGLSAGLRYVLADRRMLVLLLGIGVAGIGSDPVITLTPLLAEELVGPSGASFGVDSEELAVGVLASGFGAGAVLTVFGLRLLHDRFGCRHVGVAGLTLLGVMLTGVAVAPNLAMSTVALVLAGVGYFLAITSLTTLLQITIPEHLRGRVMALWGVCFLGSRPVAAFIDSNLAHLFSARFALVVLTGFIVTAAVFVARATRSLDAKETSA
jgi:MFS family permease